MFQFLVTLVVRSPANMQADKKLVLLAVAQNGRALDYAAPALKNDKEVVMAAVAQNGIALVEASEELQSDKEVRVMGYYDFESSRTP